MKKITFSLLAFLSVTSLCFAQQAQAPVSQPVVTKTSQAPVVKKTFSGKVDSVTIGDVKKGTKSELTVVADNGEKLSFAIRSGTPINDKGTKILNLRELKKDDKVIVEYTTSAKGTNRAQSVKIVE
ncbi:MAG: hypothetical protein PHY94_01610 [Candidatus Omnitrophica bacterium]|nr:hypothetical protein [Candidatus Omnitrophota bacterium]